MSSGPFIPPASTPQDILTAQIGNLLARVRILEAVRVTAAAGGCDLGYVYDALFSQGSVVDPAVMSGDALSYVCGMGTPAAPVLPPEGSLVVGQCTYFVNDADAMAATIQELRIVPTWWTPTYDTDGVCIDGYQQVVGHGRISRSHASSNPAYAYGGPGVPFVLLNSGLDMRIQMQYDGQVAYGGDPSAGAEYTNVPWVWEVNDILSAQWHCFTGLCGD